jgi:hypothetical protein
MMNRKLIKNLLLYFLLFLTSLGLFTIGLHQVTLHNNLGPDFYIFWNAGRALFINGQNPYSDEVAREVQMAVWQRPALPEEDQLAFAYQPHALLAVLPTIWMSYDWAQAFWISFLILTTISTFLLIFKDKKFWFALLVLFYYPFFFGIVIGNFVILITSFLLLFIVVVMLQKQSQPLPQVIFGILLAWACVKPQFIWLYMIMIVVYSLKNRLWPFLISLSTSFTGLHILSFLMYPNWVSDWLSRLNKYASYNDSLPNLTNYLANFLPSINLSWLSMLILGIMILLTGYLFYRWWQSHLELVVLLIWCGLVVFLVHPTIVSYEQTAFLIPFVIWLSIEESKQLSRKAILFWVGGAILTWTAYFLGRASNHVIVDALPFLVYLIWAGWIFRTYFFTGKRQLQPAIAKD